MAVAEIREAAPTEDWQQAADGERARVSIVIPVFEEHEVVVDFDGTDFVRR